MSTSVLKRLHITPFNPGLISAVLGTSLSDTAENISYHTIDTFPENSYGFLDLPAVEAQKLIKKLNGSILKGKTMKVEEARSRKRHHAIEEAEDSALQERPGKKLKQARKQKKENVLVGHELPPERKVKRGWTEPKPEKAHQKRLKERNESTKTQASSKYTEQSELLFRTKLPANKKDLSHKDGKRKGSERDEVVHEFAKTVAQPSFLRDSMRGTGPAAEYLDGKGWVDEEGNVIESEPKKAKQRRTIKPLAIDIDKAQTKNPTKRSIVARQEETAKPSSTHSDSDSEEMSSPEPGPHNDETSSSGSSLDDSPSEEEVSNHADDSTKSLPATPVKVHPLEALFKKPFPPDDVIKPSLEVETTFSFFGQNPVGDQNIAETPATPYTAQDNRSRDTRSAAPTPDTAHPSRFTSFESILDLAVDEKNDSSVERDIPGTPSMDPPQKAQAQQDQTEFEKQFWEKRGENNRAWKARRRAALKDQRQKENRARRPRNW